MERDPTPQAGRVHLRLGQLALQANFITEAQLKRALQAQAQEKKSGRLPRQLGLIFLSLGILREEELIFLLGQQERMRREEVQGIH